MSPAGEEIISPVLGMHETLTVAVEPPFPSLPHARDFVPSFEGNLIRVPEKYADKIAGSVSPV